MSYGKLECDIVVTELHVYDFMIKDFVIKKDVICAKPCIIFFLIMCINYFNFLI